MNKITISHIMRRALAGVIVAAAAGAVHPAHANRPDSVFIFSYANPDGNGGLKLAWSADGVKWQKLNRGNSFVNSDFGSWGDMKKMFEPKLMQRPSDGMWVATWKLAEGEEAMAVVESPDLMEWGAQVYTDTPVNPGFTDNGCRAATVKVGSRTYSGWQRKVPASLVRRLEQFGDHRAYRDALHAQTMSGDGVRFASLKPLQATLTLFPDSAKNISTNLMGIFFEDINYAADGGLYAELVQNRDFEYTSEDKSKWSATSYWKGRDASGNEVAIEVASESPLHPSNPHYAVLRGISLTNGGYDGIAVRKGEKYDFSIAARLPQGKGGKLDVALVDKSGRSIASASVALKGEGWRKYKAVLAADADAADASLKVTPRFDAEVDVDMVSLFPRDTFMGRPNGLRADLAQLLADMKPRFVRFPGGCLAHGNGIDNIYNWKESIGKLEERTPRTNTWGYHQTRGLGYHEFFQFCEDLGAEPLPVVAAGVPCQNSSRPPVGAKGIVEKYGQQGGIPMEQMDAYIQDILDLIEYANGDARTTVWGRKRAEAGHTKPFNLKYIGIGNEDMITPVFEERFNMIFDAVKAAHPEVTVIGTTGPFYEGTDYDLGWKLATEKGVPMVDEHYYVQPGWLIHNQDFYDNYDRSKPHVYLGEWAAHLDGRPSNVETALAEALYLTAVERNGDVVEMASYAPLLAREGRTQWRPDLIYFNSAEVKPTVDYYVQKLYGRNAGNEYVASALKLEGDGISDDVKKRVAVSVVRNGDEYIVKLANLLPVAVTTGLNAGAAVDGLQNATVVKTTLSGAPADTDARPVEESLAAFPTALELPPYSFTVLRATPAAAK